MGEVRSKFHAVGLETYDCLAPGLMDAIAGYTAKQNGTAYDPAKPAAAAAVEQSRGVPHPVAASGWHNDDGDGPDFSKEMRARARVPSFVPDDDMI